MWDCTLSIGLSGLWASLPVTLSSISLTALTLYSLVTVPIYDTLGEASIEHICNQTEMKYLFASKNKVHSIIT